MREFLALKGISQSRLAELASVSQATVSRALTGAPGKHSEARERLLTYIQDRIQTEGASLTGSELVLAAFRRVWDGSDEHAALIARLVEATAGFAGPGPAMVRTADGNRKGP